MRDTLAAAYAEMGDFKQAVNWQEKAIAACMKKDKAEFESRLQLYKEGKPYRELHLSAE